MTGRGIDPPPRPTYRTFVVERALPAPRERAWAALVARSGADSGLVRRRLRGRTRREQVWSLEPPWRLVTRFEDLEEAAYAQVSVTMRDDGDRSLGVWCYLVEPRTGDGDADVALEAVLEELGAMLQAEADEVAGDLA